MSNPSPTCRTCAWCKKREFPFTPRLTHTCEIDDTPCDPDDVQDCWQEDDVCWVNPYRVDDSPTLPLEVTP